MTFTSSDFLERLRLPPLACSSPLLNAYSISSSLSLSLAPRHTRTHTLMLTRTHSLAHMVTLGLVLFSIKTSRSLTLKLNHSLSHSLSLSHTHVRALTHSHSSSLSHTYTHTRNELRRYNVTRCDWCTICCLWSLLFNVEKEISARHEKLCCLEPKILPQSWMEKCRRNFLGTNLIKPSWSHHSCLQKLTTSSCWSLRTILSRWLRARAAKLRLYFVSRLSN